MNINYNPYKRLPNGAIKYPELDSLQDALEEGRKELQELRKMLDELKELYHKTLQNR